MKLEKRDDGKYELNIFVTGSIFVLTRAELDELHDLIEVINQEEHINRKEVNQ